MLNTISSAVDIGSKSADFIDTLIQKVEKYKTLKQDTTAYLRMLYIEVIMNIEVLNTVSFDSFTGISPNDPKIKALLALIRIDIAESVFYKTSDNPNTELYDRLKRKGKVNNRSNELTKPKSDGMDVKVKQRFIYENILQAIAFVVTKIGLMKMYAELPNEDFVVIKNINIKSRLINIYQRFLMIKTVMDSFDEIKEMAR
ncbi:MAG TPA: hypothetical protein PLA24_03310 [Tenuifilaceae bacterium]|nr:hypothetical protein [Tenuifilaceae bacterium]